MIRMRPARRPAAARPPEAGDDLGPLLRRRLKGECATELLDMLPHHAEAVTTPACAAPLIFPQPPTIVRDDQLETPRAFPEQDRRPPRLGMAPDVQERLPCHMR